MTARTAMLLLLAVAATLGAMTAGRRAPGPAVSRVVAAPMPTPPWQTSLERMERARAAGDINAAEVAWRDAYGHAVRSRQWEALLAVGEGSLRIGDHLVLEQPYRAWARRAWVSALFRARQQPSLDGVLKVTAAFGSLGDTAVVLQALRMADTLAALDASRDARRRVRAVRQRLLPDTAPSHPPPSLSPDPAVERSSANLLTTASDKAAVR